VRGTPFKHRHFQNETTHVGTAAFGCPATAKPSPPDHEPSFPEYFPADSPASFRTQGRRLMSDATYPAPNPLSIFTTLTLEAHEFNIPRSAAIPLNDAP
jgi:hypothetical protein